MKQKLRIIFFNISVLCILVVGAELIGQVGYYIRYGYPVFTSDQHTAGAQRQIFELHPYLAGQPKKNASMQKGNVTITTTGINTRWTGANPDNPNAIKIAVLGGSSAFGTKVTDAESWPALLQSMLGDRYAVINYGVPGYSTAEHIIQMSLILPEIKPEVVIVYAGWNDIRNYHEPDLGPDYFKHGIKQYDNLGLELQNRKSGFANLAQASAIFRFADYIAKRFNLKPTPETDKNMQPPSNTPDPYVDAIYLRNLNTLKVLAQHFGTRIVFVPQVLNYSDFRGKKGVSRYWSPYIEDDAMPELMDRFNLIMKDVCQPGESKCTVLSEVVSENWVPEDFADEGHFSKVGGDKFAKLVAAHISSGKQNQ